MPSSRDQLQVIRDHLYLITGWRRFSERLGGGASIFQDLDLGEALSAEAKLRPTEGGGKHPPEAKSFGKSSAEDLKRREMPPPPVTSYDHLH